jgi:serine/threonine-protein kinase
MTQDEAVRTLQNAGFRVTSTSRAVADQSNDGRVIDQTPTGGSTAERGSVVEIVVGQAIGGTTSTSTTSSTSSTSTTTTTEP